MAHHRSEAVAAAIKTATQEGSEQGLTDLDLQAHVFMAAFDAASAVLQQIAEVTAEPTTVTPPVEIAGVNHDNGSA